MNLVLKLLGSLWIARDRATAFMHSVVLSVLSVLLDAQLLFLPSLTVDLTSNQP